jgi:hypothetical protein
MKMFVPGKVSGVFWITAFILFITGVTTSAAIELFNGKSLLEFAPGFILAGTAGAQLFTGRDYWTLDLLAIAMVGWYVIWTATSPMNAALGAIFILVCGALTLLRAYRNGGFDA